MESTFAANSIQVLLVEDNPGDAFLIREQLLNGATRFQLTHVERLGEAIARLEKDPFDAVLLDLSLPDSCGLETFANLQARSPHVPIVVLSGTHDERIAMQAVRQGAQDYLVKGSVIAELLIQSIRYAIERKRTQAELKKRTLQLEAANQQLQRRTEQLEALNADLEAFNHTIAHDLRNPLQNIQGFSYMLLAKYSDRLDEKGQHYLDTIRQATERTGQLIQDLMHLSVVTRQELEFSRVDLSAIAREIATQLWQTRPERQVDLEIAPNLTGWGDRGLLQIALENLLGNAWKYTGKQANPRIKFAASPLSKVDRVNSDARTVREPQTPESLVYFLQDNGVGFDMSRADKIFRPFQRLHQDSEFEGTGIGLATVQRVIHSHGGRIWVDAAVERGTTFYFTLAECCHLQPTQQEVSHDRQFI